MVPINFARNKGIKNCIVIPNAASSEEFEEAQAFVDTAKQNFKRVNEKNILHVGGFTGLKGQWEAIKIFNKANIRNSRLILVGNDYPSPSILRKCKNFVRFLACNFTALRPSGIFYYKLMAFFSNWFSLKNIYRNKRILVCSLSRINILQSYLKADLFLFPSMIECSPIVIFESIASRTPFLVTDVGNSKEIIAWTNGGVLLPTQINRQGYSMAIIEESARILEKVYVDKDTLSRLAKSGYSAFNARFTWKIIAQQYDNLFKNLMTNTRSNE